MPSFSERYGYVQPSDIIIREKMPIEVSNAICNALDLLENALNPQTHSITYKDIELDLWCHFLNQKRSDFYHDFGCYETVATEYIDDAHNPWFKRLDMLEYVVQYLIRHQTGYDNSFKRVYDSFVKVINSEFKRLRYGYRIVDGKICEITSNEEIKSIETAANDKNTGVQEHLQKALEHYAKRPEGDCRNSIKESISAVEAICRELTGESTLGKAISNLEKKGIPLQSQFKQGLQNLYNYTNDEATGIRHASMKPDGEYVPSQDEAYFMLVTCSAFINYIRMKSSAITK